MENKKVFFEEPIMQIILFQNEDIIVTSDGSLSGQQSGSGGQESFNGQSA